MRYPYLAGVRKAWFDCISKKSEDKALQSLCMLAGHKLGAYHIVHHTVTVRIRMNNLNLMILRRSFQRRVNGFMQTNLSVKSRLKNLARVYLILTEKN